MKCHNIVVISLLSIILFACKPSDNPAPVAVSAVAPLAASSVTSPSPIVSEILNSPQEQDILATSRQAMQNITASDVAAVASEAAPPAEEIIDQTASNNVQLPALCEAYYQRVDRCFAKDSKDGEALRIMNQDARLDLAADNPTDQTCSTLNKSFDVVARNLACE